METKVILKHSKFATGHCPSKKDKYQSIPDEDHKNARCKDNWFPVLVLESCLYWLMLIRK